MESPSSNVATPTRQTNRNNTSSDGKTIPQFTSVLMESEQQTQSDETVTEQYDIVGPLKKSVSVAYKGSDSESPGTSGLNRTVSDRPKGSGHNFKLNGKTSNSNWNSKTSLSNFEIANQLRLSMRSLAGCDCEIGSNNHAIITDQDLEITTIEVKGSTSPNSGPKIQTEIGKVFSPKSRQNNENVNDLQKTKKTSQLDRSVSHDPRQTGTENQIPALRKSHTSVFPQSELLETTNSSIIRTQPSQDTLGCQTPLDSVPSSYIQRLVSEHSESSSQNMFKSLLSAQATPSQTSFRESAAQGQQQQQFDSYQQADVIVNESSQSVLNRFVHLLDYDWNWTMWDNPVYGSQLGFHDQDDRLQDLSHESFLGRASHAGILRGRIEKEILESKNIDNLLPHEAHVQARVLCDQLQHEEEAILHDCHLILPINNVGYGSVQNNLIEALDWMQLKTSKDFEKLRRRLISFPQQIAGFIELIRKSMKKGYKPPIDVVGQIPDTLRQLIETPPKALQMVIEMSGLQTTNDESSDNSDSDLISNGLREAVKIGFIGGLQTLLEFVEKEYIPTAVNQLGLGSCLNQIQIQSQSTISTISGRKLYELYLQYHTTLPLSAEDVHAMGLKEVKRLRERYQNEIFGPLLGIETDSEEAKNMNAQKFAENLRKTEYDKHFFKTPEELIDNYKQLLEKIATYLKDFFEDCILDPILNCNQSQQSASESQSKSKSDSRKTEPNRTQTQINDNSDSQNDNPNYGLRIVQRSCGPACIYVAGTADNSRPGMFFVNSQPLDARPRYEQPAFALHEGIPGHHLQNTYCVCNQALPNFLRVVEERRYEFAPARRQAYTAYQEGWALYAENLGEEMGSYSSSRENENGGGVAQTDGGVSDIYATKYDLFGKLSMEMKRAVRLVVDSGIHAFNWNLEQSVRYMMKETGMHQIECERECRRYAAWPAQAVSYKVGQLFFMRMRKECEEALKLSSVSKTNRLKCNSDNQNLFDLKWFHTQCLRHGPMPLAILEVEIKRAVEERIRLFNYSIGKASHSANSNGPG